MTNTKLRIAGATASILALATAPFALADDHGDHAGHDHASHSADAMPATTADFSDEQILEFMGYMMGQQMRLADDFNPSEADALISGLKLAATGGELPHDPEAIMPAVQTYMQAKEAESQQRQMQEMQAMAAEEKQIGTAFFAELDSDSTVTKSDSGLYYKITAAGSDQQPVDGDQVVVHYEGTLLDGTVFDSSIERGEPATFDLTGVIPGFTEGLKLLGEGGKATLYIPSDLAYGDMGAGGMIKPGSTLIFDVELIEIIEAEAADEG